MKYRPKEERSLGYDKIRVMDKIRIILKDMIR